MAPVPFQLLLFSTDEALVRRAVAAGVGGIVIDWEFRGKHRRQAEADTEINQDTPDDLRRIRSATAAPIICRINGVSETTPEEVETAIDCGATEILVPMVRSAAEVETVLDLAAGRCGVGMLIETTAAVARAGSFTGLPLTRIYAGLNDLAIERRSPSLFDAVADGTVERLRRASTVPFGFGGLTVPDRGHPVPCRLLMGEMARLGCGFSFLRRSFHRDVRDRPAAEAIGAIRRELDALGRRGEDEVDSDHRLLVEAIDGAVDVSRR
jgi:HpcH/HpaI aldolase/citrate lyase family